MAILRLKFKNFRKTGFTLVETLVATAILSLAVAGPLTIAHRSLMGATGARDQVTASYLAQEAIEYIRNVRDENRMSASTPWLQGLSLCVDGGICGVDAVRAAIVNCDSTNNTCRVKYDSSRGVYGHPVSSTGWIDSRFRRTVQITTVSDREARIDVAVTWATGPFATKTISLRSTLYAL